MEHKDSIEALVRLLGHTPLTDQQELLFEYALIFGRSSNPDELVDLSVALILSTRDLASPAVENAAEAKSSEPITQDAGKDTHKVLIAASNALSILNYAHLCGLLQLHSLWTHRDWSRIRVPYAILNMSIWIGCNFDYADLRYASLYRATFLGCSFKHADLQHATTSEGPEFVAWSKFLEESADVFDWDFDVAFSPNAEYFAVAAPDNLPRLGISLTRECFTLPYEEPRVKNMSSVTFSPDSRFVAMGSTTGHICIWEVATRVLRVAMSASKSRLVSLAWSPDGLLLASACLPSESESVDPSPATVKIWDVSLLEQPRLVSILETSCKRLVFAPDSSKLALADVDARQIHVWEIPSLGSPRRIFQFPCSSSPARISFSNDGFKLAATSNGGDRVYVWDLTKGRLILSERLTLFEVHGRRFRRLATGFPAFDLISGGALTLDSSNSPPKPVTEALERYGTPLWKLLPPLLVAYPVLSHVSTYDTWERFLAYSPDGRYALRSANHRLTLRVSDLSILPWLAALQTHLESSTQVQPLPKLRSLDSPVPFVLSADGSVLFSTTGAGIVISDLSSGAVSGCLNTRCRAGVDFTDMVLSADGRYLASISYSKVFVWDVSTYEMKLRRFFPVGGLKSVAIAWDGSKVAIAGSGSQGTGLVYVLPLGDRNYVEDEPRVLSLDVHPDEDMKDGARFQVPAWYTCFLAFAPDGQTLAFVGCGKFSDSQLDLTLFDLTMSTSTTMYSTNTYESCRGLSFSPNGEHILMAGPSEYVTVWNVGSRSQEMKLAGHNDYVLSAMYTRDSEFIISADHYCIRFWHVGSSRCVQTLACMGTVMHFAGSSDASVLVVATTDPVQHSVWKVDLEAYRHCHEENKTDTDPQGLEARRGETHDLNSKGTSHSSPLPLTYPIGSTPFVKLVKVIGRSTWLTIRDCQFDSASTSPDLTSYTRPRS